MKKLFRKITSSLLGAAVAAAVGVSTSAFAAQTTDGASADKIGTFRTIGHRDMIYTLDDYLLSVKKNFISNDEIRAAVTAAENYVPYVDNSKLKYFPKIDSQGSIGSCVSWSVVYYQFTHEVNKALDRAADKTTTMQPMFIYNMYIGCNAPRHLEGLLNGTGCAPLSMAPEFYNDKTWNTGYDTWREAANYRMYDYIDLAGFGEPGREITSETDPDLDAIKAVLRNGDVLSYAGPINDHQWDTIKAAPGVDAELVGQGIVTHSVGSCVFNHMLTVVGYNDNIWVDLNKNGKVDAGEKGALKIANSWGEKWGNTVVAQDKRDGFFWIAYDALNAKSCVTGVVNEANRGRSASGFGRILVSKDFGTSGIFLKYTLNNDNRTDSYVELTAKRKTDGMTYTRKVNPYYFANYEYVPSQRLNYEGKTGFCDGSMVYDLNNVIQDLDSNNFNDYTWSCRFVDIGTDSAATTVKEAYIIDENTNKTYNLNTAFPFTLNKTERTAALKDYYHFAKLYVPDASTLTVGSELKFTFKTANETFGSSPIKYTMTITKDGKQVFSKLHKATTVDKTNRCSVIKGTWKPTATGIYTITITGTDATGTTISRSADFRVYNKLLAVRSINLDKGKYLNQYETVRITPQITGGTAPYQYAAYYKKASSSSYTAVRGYSTAATMTLTPATATTYDVRVKVKDSVGTVVSKDFTLKVTASALSNTSTVSATSVTLGKAVTITGKATGGTAPYQYSAWYKKTSSSTYTLIRDFKSTSTMTLTPAVATTYDLRVKVKDAKGTVKNKDFTIKVTASALANASTVSATSVALGKSVTITGKATGGTAPYQYSAWYKKTSSSTYTLIRDFKSTSTMTLTPAVATTYDLRVKVRDAKGTVKNKDFTIKVTASALANTSTISATSITLGKSVTVTAKATGGTAPYQYCAYYKKSSSTEYTKAYGFGTTTKMTIKPAVATTYDIRVKVKDAKGTIATKDFKVKVS